MSEPRVDRGPGENPTPRASAAAVGEAEGPPRSLRAALGSPVGKWLVTYPMRHLLRGRTVTPQHNLILCLKKQVTLFVKSNREDPSPS